MFVGLEIPNLSAKLCFKFFWYREFPDPFSSLVPPAIKGRICLIDPHIKVYGRLHLVTLPWTIKAPREILLLSMVKWCENVWFSVLVYWSLGAKKTESNKKKSMLMAVQSGFFSTAAILVCVSDTSGQIITTSAEVTLNCGFVRESPQNPLNSGLGIILICPEYIPVEYCEKQFINSLSIGASTV